MSGNSDLTLNAESHRSAPGRDGTYGALPRSATLLHVPTGLPAFTPLSSTLSYLCPRPAEMSVPRRIPNLPDPDCLH